MSTVSTATMRMFSRYLLEPIWGSQPAMVLWFMMPTLPAPLGTSQMMMK